MGLDKHALAFLLKKRAEGVEFTEVLTLGRQEITISEPEFKSLLSGFGIKPQGISEAIFSSKPHYAEPFFKLLGCRHVFSIDASDYESPSFVHDFNLPLGSIPGRKFNCVIDGGTLEHIFNYPQALKNCMNLVADQGCFIGISPANNQMGHGFYQLSPELIYRVFNQSNEFSDTEVYLYKMNGSRHWYKVCDPLSSGGRVMLCNNKPMNMISFSKKSGTASIHEIHVQQSDYVSLWNVGKAAAGKKSPIRTFAETLLPQAFFQRLYKSFLDYKDLRRMQLNSPNFIKISF
jgi:hypothetical protein